MISIILLLYIYHIMISIILLLYIYLYMPNFFLNYGANLDTFLHNVFGETLNCLSSAPFLLTNPSSI